MFVSGQWIDRAHIDVAVGSHEFRLILKRSKST